MASGRPGRLASPGSSVTFRDPLHWPIWVMAWDTRQFTHGEAVSLSNLPPAAGSGQQLLPEKDLEKRQAEQPCFPHSCSTLWCNCCCLCVWYPWWLFLLWPSPLTSWTKPISCSNRDICAPKGTVGSRARGQPAALWDRLYQGLPAARCFGSTPAWQRCRKYLDSVCPQDFSVSFIAEAIA